RPLRPPLSSRLPYTTLFRSVINGKAGFASMSEGAKYTFMAGLIDRGEGQEPDICIALPNMDTPGIRLLYNWDGMGLRGTASHDRSEEHTSELQSRENLVCRL